ncbi:MAG: DNA methylase [Prevotella sp.]|nr:DNA methylase [Prevotella sp.]
MANTKQRAYIAIDLKSFYASVECVERRLDPLTTCLVVADKTRTEKTICLAVTPALKAYGIPGRARLFEVIQRVNEINRLRKARTQGKRFVASSVFAPDLALHPDFELDYITAPPRMALYLKYSARIYDIYLKYIAPEDIHVYSVDEVFIDTTNYLASYKMTAHELAQTMISDVLSQTGITATAGIGTNLFLCKIAMDIMAKHAPADEHGVRIAELDEGLYRRQLWGHRPLTDFWRIGKGVAAKLSLYGIDTMGKIARCSVENEELLYKLFGVNAELIIDHAWGYEPCTIKDIKAYRPTVSSLSSGQVLSEPYTRDKALIIVREMADNLALNLMEKGLVTSRITLRVGYDAGNINPRERRTAYQGPAHTDRYGRQVPRHSFGTVNLSRPTDLSKEISEAAATLFRDIANPDLLIRRLNIVAADVVCARDVKRPAAADELDLFTPYDAVRESERRQEAAHEKERNAQQAVLRVKRRYGKNAILRGMNFAEGATARRRNEQIGGHKA